MGHCRWRWLEFVAAGGLAFFGAMADESHVPMSWSKFVKVAGQAELIPEQWLDTDEARIAHDMKLPEAVAKTIPFDFGKARWRAWLPWEPELGRQYFNHLCDTEAGEWVLKKAPPQPGIYNARPIRPNSVAEAQARYDLEAPALQRNRNQSREGVMDGSYFVGEPHMPYYFVEEPRRAVHWQAHVTQPYIRMFGFALATTSSPEQPMKLIGIERLSARYAFTWRGAKRASDRENSVSGVEEMVYDRDTGEVLAVRRQFIYAPPYKGRPQSNRWLQGEACLRLSFRSTGLESVTRLPALAVPSAKQNQMPERQLLQPVPIVKTPN